MNPTVHYAPHFDKCLSHRVFGYAAFMESPNERLRQLRAARFQTMEEGARFVGANINTYRQHENDTRNLNGLPRKAAQVYASKYRVSLDWLLTGKGEKEAPDPDPSEAEFEQMLREVIESEVTVSTLLVDLPRIVAPALREQLERYRSDRAGPPNPGPTISPGKGARSPAATTTGEPAGSHRT